MQQIGGPGGPTLFEVWNTVSVPSFSPEATKGCMSLYVMGLSLRDLQEALYPLLGAVLSVNAINRITQVAQQQMDQRRTAKITTPVPILLVDGVWVRIQYPSEETLLVSVNQLSNSR